MTYHIVGDGLAGLVLARRLLDEGNDVVLYGDGQTNTPPVGLVHLAAARRGGPVKHLECRFGDIGRGPIRLATIKAALDLVSKLL